MRDRFIVGARLDSGGVAKCSLTGAPTQIGGSVEHTHTFTTDGHLHGTKSGGPFDGSVGTIDIVKEKDEAIRKLEDQNQRLMDRLEAIEKKLGGTP
mgnify:CR=1 FL=1